MPVKAFHYTNFTISYIYTTPVQIEIRVQIKITSSYNFFTNTGGADKIKRTQK